MAAAPIGQTSTPLLAASSTTWRNFGGTIPSAVAANTQLSGTAWPAHLSMQQVGSNLTSANV